MPGKVWRTDRQTDRREMDGRTDGQTDDGEVIPKCHLRLHQVTQKLAFLKCKLFLKKLIIDYRSKVCTKSCLIFYIYHWNKYFSKAPFSMTLFKICHIQTNDVSKWFLQYWFFVNWKNKRAPQRQHIILKYLAIFKNVAHILKPGEPPSNSASHQAPNYVQLS